MRPQLAIVIFDSHEAGGWKAHYMSAVAEQLTDVDEAIEELSREGERKGTTADEDLREDVLPPARHRLYRAIASEQFVLDEHDQRLPVDLTEPEPRRLR